MGDGGNLAAAACMQSVSQSLDWGDEAQRLGDDAPGGVNDDEDGGDDVGRARRKSK